MNTFFAGMLVGVVLGAAVVIGVVVAVGNKIGGDQ